jgi:hypothetical protein
MALRDAVLAAQAIAALLRRDSQPSSVMVATAIAAVRDSHASAVFSG